jgi:AcrR family transcriptional regulator
VSVLAPTGAGLADDGRVTRKRPSPRASLRRVPRRAPSKRIFEAILQSAIGVLSGQGFARLTTNRIAEHAGVSIGSVYQYFPDKHAVVAALARSLEERALAMFGAIAQTAQARSLSEVTGDVVRGLASESFGQIGMRRELLRHVPRAWLEPQSREVDGLVIGQLAQLLEARDDVRPGDRELMAFVAVHAVEAVMEAAVLRRPELLTDERFLTELTELSVRYLSHEQGGLNPTAEMESA